LSVSQEHEIFSRMIASLLIDYFVEKDIEFNPLGSFTQEKGEEVSAQADESFLIGKSTGITPDLSIEVVFTSGGKRKLTRYQALGVPEVWFWEDGVFGLYHINSANIGIVKSNQQSILNYPVSFSTPPSTVNSQQSTIIPVQPELISFAIARL